MPSSGTTSIVPCAGRFSIVTARAGFVVCTRRCATLMSVNGHAAEPPTGPARPDQTDPRQSGIAVCHDGRHLEPEILALLARADAAVLRSRELIATLNDLSRVVADAVQRTDAWLAATT